MSFTLRGSSKPYYRNRAFADDANEITKVFAITREEWADRYNHVTSG